jgi:hypothetical protein
VLQIAALLMIGLVLAMLFRALGEVSPLPWLLCFFVFLGLSVMFVRGLMRLFGLAAPEAQWAACPSTNRLEALLGDRVPAPENRLLAAHLEACKACQHKVEGLTAAHRSWPGLARKLSDRPPSPEPALRRVMDRLKDEPQDEATRDEPRVACDTNLGFLSPPDKPGQLGRLERYEVLEEIGRGGMGVVLKAFDPSLHRVVAIKVLAPQLATSGVARKRFLREARAAAAVTHDHIVTIHAVDEANGLPYLVMQYVAGRSLQDRIDKEGPLETDEVLRIGMQTAAGLAAAHAHGIVHRDIKPANILLEEGVPRIKITDFGLARAMDDASLTQSGFVAGSPLYMAPEQARGETLDHRADLFSLGSVLYTLCTGRPPFRAHNTLAVLRRVSEDTPRPIKETNPEVPDWLASVVEKLMDKDPAARYGSAAEVVEVLGQHLAQMQHAPWVPAARSPTPAGANVEAGLPSSVTICPSCGASLHVPEQMVGNVVHCAECGKPFHVEEGSKVIQVARAVQSRGLPPLRRLREVRARHLRRIPRWVWIAAGCAALLLIFLLLSLQTARQARMAEAAARMQWSAANQGAPPSIQHRAAPMTAAAKKPSAPQTRAAGKESLAPSLAAQSPVSDVLKNQLSWLPAEGSMFGAIDLGPLGPLALDEARTRTLLRMLVPEETAGRLTPENLGRIRIDGIAIAYYEGPNAEDAWGIAHLDGLALDGRKRMVDFIRQGSAQTTKVEENNQAGRSDALIRVSNPELPFALGIYDDNHVFLARSMRQGAAAPQHLKALEQHHLFDFAQSYKHSGDILSGYNPPWVKSALAEIPSDACGVLLGEIPAAWRKFFTEALNLRVCPRTFVLHLRRENQDVGVSLTLSVDNTGADVMLQEDLEEWSKKGLDAWKDRFASLRAEPERLALVGLTLKTMRWKASGGSVQTHVKINDSTWKALGALLRRGTR